MSKDTFTFEGHVSEEQYKPYIPWESYATLEAGQILTGTVDHVIPGDVTKVQVLINGHLMGVPVWGSDAMAIRIMVGSTVKVAFTGLKDGYPRLKLML